MTKLVKGAQNMVGTKGQESLLGTGEVTELQDPDYEGRNRRGQAQCAMMRMHRYKSEAE